GEGAEVRVNQITGKIVTVIRFSSPGRKVVQMRILADPNGNVLVQLRDAKAAVERRGEIIIDESVGFLTMARHRESGESATGPSRHIRSVIDNANIENQKLIEASPVQRKLFDLLLVDQSRGRAQRGVHERRFLGYGDLLSRSSDFQRQVDDR